MQEIHSATDSKGGAPDTPGGSWSIEVGSPQYKATETINVISGIFHTLCALQEWGDTSMCYDGNELYFSRDEGSSSARSEVLNRRALEELNMPDLYNVITEQVKGLQSSLQFKLPSRHQINSPVILDFYAAGELTGVKVIKVHFAESKVLYDVEITQPYKDNPDRKWSTRLYNIDSEFVKAAA